MSPLMRNLYDLYSVVCGLWHLDHEFDTATLKCAKLVEHFSELENIGTKQQLSRRVSLRDGYAIHGYLLSSIGTIVGTVKPFTEQYNPFLNNIGVSTKIRHIILSMINCPRMPDIRAIVIFASRISASTPEQLFVFKLGIQQSPEDLVVACMQSRYEAECTTIEKVRSALLKEI